MPIDIYLWDGTNFKSSRTLQNEPLQQAIFCKDRFSYPHQGGWGAWGRLRWPWLGAVNILLGARYKRRYNVTDTMGFVGGGQSPS